MNASTQRFAHHANPHPAWTHLIHLHSNYRFNTTNPLLTCA